MPRLRNRVTGVVVSVRDEQVSRLGSDYEPVEKAEPKAPRKRAASSKSEK